MSAARQAWVAGVDGCPNGWAVVLLDTTGTAAPRLRRLDAFADLLTAPEAPVRIAVDMPIGLPERITGTGRAAEKAVRPLLAQRQSTVFSIPGRAAIYAEPGPFSDKAALYDAHRRASAIARLHSAPPRAIAIQAFMIFPKIREIDSLMNPELANRVFETHPEMAFRRLNDDQPVPVPKKRKGRPHGPGLALRRKLLARHGYSHEFLALALPPGVGEDDRLDAAACALTAARLFCGAAKPYPDPPDRDERGLTIAIWV